MKSGVSYFNNTFSEIRAIKGSLDLIASNQKVSATLLNMFIKDTKHKFQNIINLWLPFNLDPVLLENPGNCLKICITIWKYYYVSTCFWKMYIFFNQFILSWDCKDLDYLSLEGKWLQGMYLCELLETTMSEW